MPCIFCASQENLTDEHIFPAFMGGGLKVRHGSCERCNREYSIAEAALKEATIPLLNLLQVKNRDGVVPNAPLNAEIRGLDMKNLQAFMDGKGEIQLLDKVAPPITVQGRQVRQGLFITKAGGDKFAERGRKRGDELIQRKVPEQVVIDANYTVNTSFAQSLEARKIAATIALTAIAYQYGHSFALSKQFDELRETRTARAVRVWIFVNEGLMSDHPRTAHEHSVICYLSAGIQKGWALVTLFGGLTYRVDLTADYTERESRKFSIFYDANLKKRVNPIVLYEEIALIGHVLSSASKFEDGDALHAQWYPIVSSFCAQKGLTVETVDVTPKA
jgi:hypothetical protein